jgi:microsomal epoxide hydrolase
LSEKKHQISNRNPAPVNFCIMPEPEGVSPDSANDPEKKSLVQAGRFGRIGSAYAFRTRNPSEHYRLGFGVEPAGSTGMVSSSTASVIAFDEMTPDRHGHGRISEKLLDWTDEDLPLGTILEAVALDWLTETFPRLIYPYRQVSW